MNTLQLQLLQHLLPSQLTDNLLHVRVTRLNRMISLTLPNTHAVLRLAQVLSSSTVNLLPELAMQSTAAAQLSAAEP